MSTGGRSRSRTRCTVRPMSTSAIFAVVSIPHLASPRPPAVELYGSLSSFVTGNPSRMWIFGSQRRGTTWARLPFPPNLPSSGAPYGDHTFRIFRECPVLQATSKRVEEEFSLSLSRATVTLGVLFILLFPPGTFSHNVQSAPMYCNLRERN